MDDHVDDVVVRVGSAGEVVTVYHLKPDLRSEIRDAIIDRPSYVRGDDVDVLGDVMDAFRDRSSTLRRINAAIASSYPRQDARRLMDQLDEWMAEIAWEAWDERGWNAVS